MYGFRKPWLLGVLTLTMVIAFSVMTMAVTVRIQDWRLAEEPAGPCLEELIAAFEKENPDIDVVLDPVSIADKITKFVTQSQGGDPPDVVRILTTDVPGWVDMGLLLPLDDLVANAGGSQYLSDFTPFLINAMTIGGNLYGIPHEGDALVLYYNAEMFREAGLDPDNPPKTCDEFVAAGKKITDPAKGQYLFGMLAHPSIANIWMQSWFLANGSNFFNEDYTDTLLDSPAGIEAFKYYVELYTKHGVVPPGPTDIDYAAQVNLFTQEKVAVIIGPFATFGGIKIANPDLDLRMMAVPGKVKSSSGRGTVYSIAAGSEHPEAAFKLIQYITDAEPQLKFYREATMLPTRRSVAELPEIKDNPELKVMFKAIDTAVSYPIYARWAETNRVLVDALHAALLGAKTPEQAAKDGAAEIRRIMNR